MSDVLSTEKELLVCGYIREIKPIPQVLQQHVAEYTAMDLLDFADKLLDKTHHAQSELFASDIGLLSNLKAMISFDADINKDNAKHKFKSIKGIGERTATCLCRYFEIDLRNRQRLMEDIIQFFIGKKKMILQALRKHS